MKLIEYWPPFIREMVTFKVIAGALQPEFDEAAAALRSVPENFYIVSLGRYGIERWEEILGIIPEPGASLIQRRETIAIRYVDRLPYTYRALLQYLHSISTDVTVVLDTTHYYVGVRAVLSGPAQAAELRRTLRQMVPQNMTVFLQMVLPHESPNAMLAVASGMITTITHIHKPA